ncbi:hypothetical protein [Antrihabitans stalactiti]|nr:hypothetical protein [Antrihabitans stalactiti]
MAKVIGGPCIDVMDHRPCAKQRPVERLFEWALPAATGRGAV